MTTSGTYVFAPEVAEFCEEAFERCGLDPASLTTRHLRSARRSLNLMFSEWSNKGVSLWAVDQQTLTVTQGLETYETPVGTIAVLDVAVRSGGIDVPIYPMARDEYLAIPNKTTEGIISRWYFNRISNDATTTPTVTLGTPTLTFWNSPQNSTDQIIYYRLRQLQDVGGAAKTLDIPARWTEAVASGLAAKLAVKYAADRIGPLKGEANSQFAAAKQEDRERTPSNLRVKYNVGLRRT